MTFQIQTPTEAPGAVAVVTLVGDGVRDACIAIGIRPPGPGAVSRQSILGLDDGLVATVSERSVLLMPHGGSAITRAIATELESHALRRSAPDPCGAFPESRNEIEGRMLHALSRAKSPLAMDLLLAQPARWAAHEAGHLLADARVLNRLIDPPTVVAVGEPNIGKSSLLNRLAGSTVALAWNAPGTTRDEVGVELDLGGLTVRWVDTPGVEASTANRARKDSIRADLVVLCADSSGPAPRQQELSDAVQVATRCDTGSQDWQADVRTSAATGEGIHELVALVRERLVPQSAIDDSRPWKFWED